MWLSKEAIRANLVADMTTRFPARHGNFPDKLKISALGFPSPESLREWGKALNRAPWFTGWFAPSEFLACVTVGPVPNSNQPNIVDLMFNTQTRPHETSSTFAAMARLSDAASGRTRKRAAAKKASRAAKGRSNKAAKGTKRTRKAKGTKKTSAASGARRAGKKAKSRRGR
ncbi:protein of unknown function [Bradyrhizobium vignae]|uniref:Uncharacterized protein n=2 Tax=Bradyrhizobium vignae TaxID=1549949 RepID=A0A2U3PUK5_9BRAD|nr:protein of unknown function [Bradyrhizobium vignae]